MLNDIEYMQKYPVSNQLYRTAHYLNKLHHKGMIKPLNGMWPIIYMKLNHISVEIYDQEYIKHNIERYKNGQDTNTK